MIVNSGSCHFGSANDAIGRTSALESASVQTRCRKAADAERSTIEATVAASRISVVLATASASGNHPRGMSGMFMITLPCGAHDR